MIYIGIDPGASGAIAAVDKDGLFIVCEDIPIIQDGKSKAIDAHALCVMIRNITNLGITESKAAVEHVHAMPVERKGKDGKIIKQGATSIFNFGKSYGTILGVIGSLMLQRHDVPPQTWKRHHGLIGKDKEASRGLAIKLFPIANLSRKKDHGMAEALLIAKWLRDTDK